MIIDTIFPWWALGLNTREYNILKIWLTDASSLQFQHLINEWWPQAKVHFGVQPPTQWKEEHPQVVLVGGYMPTDFKLLGGWNNNITQVIVATRGLKVSIDRRWSEHRIKVPHHILGGVTDGYNMLIHYLPKDSKFGRFNVEVSLPRQDARWILKSGIKGTFVDSPNRPLAPEAAERVCYHSKGVISCASLIPSRYPEVKVHTEFRGPFWVVRELTYFERLLSIDVPEKLIRQVDENQRRLLWDCHHTPIKILHHVSQHVSSQVGVANNDIVESIEPPRKKPRTVEIIHHNAVPVGEGRSMEDSAIHLSQGPRRTSMFIQRLATVPESSEFCSSEESLHCPILLRQIKDPNARATKRDDAEVRIDIWDGFVLQGLSEKTDASTERFQKALNCLRSFFLRVWKNNVRKSYETWLSLQQSEELKNAVRTDAEDCLRRVEVSDWWSWNQGTRPLFWRWPDEYQQVIRRGVEPWFTSTPTPWKRKQRPPVNDDIKMLVKSKLDVIREKRYIETGKIISLMSYFDVPKGGDDIRMVYDGSASGLNANIWAPWFPLPTVDALMRALEPGYVMADNDVGEMFHNFILHDEMKQYCGMDLTLYYRKTESDPRIWERWTRLAMGLRSSPYNACQGMMMAVELILGNKDSEDNVFRWDRIRLNLPGMSQYTPSKSWFSKVRKDGVVAADVFVYVDDVRSSAPTHSEAWTAAQRVSSKLAYLGLQDAARKRREPSTEAGAWTGSVVWTSNNQVSALTTEEKWAKTKAHLKWIWDNMDSQHGLDHKTLQSIRGFLVYVSRTYPSMVPYLKGIHATIDSWRPGRNEDGWKVIKGRKRLKASVREESDIDIEAVMLNNKLTLGSAIEPSEPKFVFPVRRLRSDILSLLELTKPEVPPHRRVRMNSQAKVVYGFGDASKIGFGTTIELPDQSLHWRYGQWKATSVNHDPPPGSGVTLKEESSNFRELRNLVEALEEAFNQQLLTNCEIFMFTDNSTAESAFFRGTSSSEKLFDLVLRLRKIEMSGICIFHMIHVAGTRMIWQGTDGLSRGDFTTGVMVGKHMLSFVPLHLSACDRSTTIIPWIQEWYPPNVTTQHPVVLLNAEDWPMPHTESAMYVWLPPPAVADVATEYLAQSIHKRPHHMHLFICPRLMTARWMRMAGKIADFVLRIPVGSEIWGTNLGVLESPQQASIQERFCKACLTRILIGRGLNCANSSHTRGVWPNCKGHWCHGCYKLEDEGLFPIRRPKDEEGSVLVVEKDSDRFLFGREGDEMLTTFQCDLCHFRNMTRRNPHLDGSDNTLLKYIRRANLDALWSREPATVKNTFREIRTLKAKSDILGLSAQEILPPMGPFPVEDTHGMSVAVCILMRSLDSGRNEDTIQFATTQKMKSAYANIWRASLKGGDGAVIARDTVKLFNTSCPTHSDWFERFSKGMHERMGDKVKQDLGITIEQMLALMSRYEARWEGAEGDPVKQSAVLFPALFSLISFCCALRGEETPLMNLTGTVLHMEEAANHRSHPHVVVALLGRFKMETGEHYHLMPLVPVTSSGLEPAKWMGRMVKWYTDKGIYRGWVFRRKDGSRAKASDYEWDILSELEHIQQTIPGVVCEHVNVFEEFGVSRSFRRGSDAHAINQGVSTSDIERNNRWRTVEQARGKAPRLRMIHHYSDMRQLLVALLRYSRPL